MAHVDLNLLRAFVLLFETRSVTLTADRLFVTQPSVSYALSKLRELFDDRLFVRSRQGMEPTMTARQLYPSLRDALRQLEATIESGRDFDPASCQRRFRLALTDLGEMSLLPAILHRLHAQAPGLELEVVPLEIARAEEWLTSGTVNAVICSRPIDTPGIERRIILKDRYVCLFDRTRFGDGKLTMERFTAGRHAMVASSSGHGLAEEVLNRLEVPRKISLEVSHFSILPRILHGSDLLAILPWQITTAFAEAPLEWCELPFAVPEFDVALYWQAQACRSPSQRWFCDTIIEAVATA
ncbi:MULTISPECIES: LysR family transcriptional regulator [Halomonadaceae]|uniref:LysR family transcriptional regulator n=1 Tax=Halomonadaceae TaxID=28256 RepID=UPI00159A8185|nr:MULTISPECIES: LysR family transcriptional regulator [Halomonas]QJQ94196.1 LysR family transcriptional regulator [Halomonas sp. PA5]